MMSLQSEREVSFVNDVGDIPGFRFGGRVLEMTHEESQDIRDKKQLKGYGAVTFVDIF